MTVVDERTLCARLKSWIDAELAGHGYGNLSRAETEVHASGSHKRHDLLIYAGNKPVFSAEVKVPYNKEGSTPYHPVVVGDARAKAEREGLAYFGTLNCASFVLWKVDWPGVPVLNRSVDRWTVVESQHLVSLDSPEAERSFKEWIKRLLPVVAAIDAGADPAGPAPQPGDELVDRIEGSLDTIVGLTLPDVVERFTTDGEFRRDVKRWMIKDRGWQWDDKQRDDLLLRTVKVACYLQMNRLLFYTTLQSRFDELQPLDLSAARSGRGIRSRLEPRFTHAMEVSRDYETVFNVGYITEVSYAADASTAAWAGLLPGIAGVDLSAVRLDVLGGIFERLLSPEERHRFGQHYTNTELVDVLVAAAVHDRTAVVLDPASGGGTFLVRAYERLRQLGEQDHVVLLSQLYGNDLSRFAGHLTTVNLAVRQIAREENYPRVGTHDFFRLSPGSTLAKLPIGGGDPPERTSIPLPNELDAVVGNPPYVRRQAIDESTLRRAEQAVHAYALDASRPSFKLDGLSDLHTYFWPHSTRFLRPGGYLAFLTSNGWLQTRYGERLKQLLLNEYDILFMAETAVEPWFSDARVKTVATVARRRPRGTEVDDDHRVHFAMLRRPLVDLLGPADAPDRWARVEELLQELVTAQSSDDLRVRSVKQTDLVASADWSPALRAPDIYTTFADLPGVKEICSATPQAADPYDLVVGPKLGSSWFVVDDVSNDATDSELSDWRITRKQLSGSSPTFRIVESAGWRGPIEGRYLKRWMRGPGDEPTRTVSRNAGDLVVTIPRSPKPPRTARVWDYVRFGEDNNEHTRVYNSQRGEFWYSVEEMPRGPIIAPAASQYGHKIWANPGSRTRTTSPNAYVTPKGATPEVALALLNSTWTYCAALFDAGSVGTEGLVRFGGRGQWQRLHVIDPSRATAEQADRLTEIWADMSRTEVQLFPPEGNEPLTGTRRELDELALMVAGIGDRVEASELVDELYRWIPVYTASRADVEDMAVAGRGSTSGSARIQNIVEQASSSISLDPPWYDEIDALWEVAELPDAPVHPSTQGELFAFDGHVEEATDLRFGDEWVRFESEGQAGFVRALAEAALAPRRLRIPPPALSHDLTSRAEQYVDRLRVELREAMSERISEADPSYSRAYIQALGHVAAAVRTRLHAD